MKSSVPPVYHREKFIQNVTRVPHLMIINTQPGHWVCIAKQSVISYLLEINFWWSHMQIENHSFKIYARQIKCAFPERHRSLSFHGSWASLSISLWCPPAAHHAPTCVLITERELSALSTLFYKSSVFFIAFIYYICKIYLSNDKSLFGAHRLGK